MILPFTPQELRGSVRSRNGVLYISSTSLESFLGCSQAGYYSRIRRLYLKGPFPAALMFGQVVHSVMARFVLTGKLPSFLSRWSRYKDKKLYYNKQEQDWMTLATRGGVIVEGMADKLREMQVGKAYRVGNTERYTVEVQAPTEVVPKIVLTRTFDALVRTPDGPTLIDFKTAGRMYSEGDQDRKSVQLTCYSYPHDLERVPQYAQIGFLVGTKTKSPNVDWFPTERTGEDRNQLRRDIRVVADMIKRNKYTRDRHSRTCGTEKSPYCSFYAICYGFKDAKKLYGRKR